MLRSFVNTGSAKIQVKALVISTVLEFGKRRTTSNLSPLIRKQFIEIDNTLNLGMRLSGMRADPQVTARQEGNGVWVTTV